MTTRLAAPIPALALVLIAIPAGAETPPAPVSYRVAVAAGLRALDVEACFEGTPPARLEAADPRSRSLIRGPGDARTDRVHFDRGTLRLDGLRAGDCVRYGVDLAPVVDAGRTPYHRRAAALAGTDLMVSPGLWLWRPVGTGQSVDAQLQFVLPDGVEVSAPWRLLARAPRAVRYRIGTTPADWNGVVALGRFSVEEIALPAGRLRLAVLDGRPAPDPAAIAQWIREAALAVTAIYGRFPLPDVQILVVPIAEAEEAVPFAQVLRGGGSAIRFFIDTRYPLEDFLQDWTAVHEFAHLVHPYFTDRDVWVAEGIASYYQNVLRARRGIITPREAWQRLHAGFQRGLRGTDGRTLSEVAEFMHRDGAYMRVYWSGAAVALLADLALRERSGGAQSLDTALEKFQECCLPADRLWSAREFFSRLDALSDTSIFSELFQRYADSPDFPDLRGAYRSLGLDASEPQIRLRDLAGARRLREAIMRGSPVPADALP